jgi:hypothetical protein
MILPKKHLTAILIFCILLCSVYASLLSAAAAEPDFQDRALSFLGDVVGVKL